MRRTVLLRLAAVAALVASAFLTADLGSATRAFCPLDGACDRASESELGTVAGIPTSVLGMAAFGALFLLTLLPRAKARLLLMPAGYVALASGLVLVAFQAYWLRSFCPLCLVADGAGIAAGAIAITWPRPLPYRWGGWMRFETGPSRVLWTVFATAAVVVPLHWPRPIDRGWIAIKPVVDLDERWFPASAFVAPAQAEAPAHESDPAPVPAETAAPARAPTAVPFDASATVLAVHAPLALPVEPEEIAVAAPPPESLAPAPQPAPEPAQPPAKPAPPNGLLVVEYVNAYCPHCRETHGRLERVAERLGVPLRFRRVYVWRSSTPPLWARACAHAQSVGLEDRFFEELIRTRSRDRNEVYEAAVRAGLDLGALKRAVLSGPRSERLERDRRLVRAARLSKLPTIDLGRRRLMGSQSEGELRVALRAALALRGGSGTP